MQNQQMPLWLDQLVTRESSKITKQAQDDSDEAKIKELTEKINNAKTPEELDEIEKELKAIESKSAGASDSSESDTADEADAGTDDSADEADAGTDDSADEADTGAEAGAEESDTQDSGDDNEEADLDKIMKEIKDIKSDVSGESLQKKLVNELEKLNDQLGLNKIVDLNSTVDTGM